jgi:hypothetical protein
MNLIFIRKRGIGNPAWIIFYKTGILALHRPEWLHIPVITCADIKVKASWCGGFTEKYERVKLFC